MKKLTIIIISIFCIIITIVSVILLMIKNPKDQATDINLISFYNVYETNFVTKVPSNKVSYSMPRAANAIIKEDIFDNIIKDKQWTKSNIQIHDINYDVGLTYVNNNYYCCYENNDTCYISLVSSNVIYGKYNFYLPINMIEYLDFKNLTETSNKTVEEYFKNNTFEETLSFYQKYNDYVTINNDNKNITFNCFDINSKTIIKVMLDFNSSNLKILINDEYVTINN